MAKVISIAVSDTIKAAFLKEGKALVAKDYEYNQALNAYATLNCLKALGVDLAGAELADVLGVLMKGGNASAARQAIEGKEGKVARSTEIADDLVN